MVSSPPEAETPDPLATVTASPPRHSLPDRDALFPDHLGLDRDDPWRPLGEESRQRRPGRTLGQVSEGLEVVALAIAMFLVVSTISQNFIVEGSSMTPTFSNSELVIVNRLAYLDLDLSWLPTADSDHWRPFGEPQPGDVVVFASPGDESRDFIKRIVAIPGQTIEIQNGALLIDGVARNEPYLDGRWAGNSTSQLVPERTFFVMGDNRNNSYDSRSWGFLDQDLLVGRADFRYWPFDRFGMVDHYRCSADQPVRISLTQ